MLQKVLNTANFSDKIIVHIKKTDQGTIEDMTQLATAITDSLQTNFKSSVKEIQGVVNEDDALEIIDFVYQNLPLFLAESDYALLQQKMNEDSIQAITKANFETLVSPTGMLAKTTIARDPLAITFQGMNQLKALNASDNFVLKNGFLVSKDEQDLLLFVTPVHSTSETAANEIFVARLESLRQQLNAVYGTNATATIYGGVLIAVANAQQIKKDIQYTVGISVLVLLLVFVLFYKRVLIPLILFVPTVFGALLSVALLTFLRGEISAISLGIGSVLLGVTLDYSLHILTHIKNGETKQQVYKSVTKPMIMSSLSTAFAFLCLLFIDSQALQDLGLFAAVSVLGAAFFALVFIPQVYVPPKIDSSKRNLIDRIARYSFQSNKFTIALLVLVVVASVFTYNNVVFNKDLTALNYVPKQLKDAELQLDGVMNTKSKSLYVVTYGDKLETALQANENAFKKLTRLKEDKKLLSFNSVAGLVSSEKNQFSKIERWNTFWQEGKIDSVTNLLKRSGAEYGFKSTSFAQFYETLSANFQPITLVDYTDVPSLSVTDFITETKDFSTVTTLVKVSEENSELLTNTFQDVKNTLVVDRLAMNETLLGNLKNQFNQLVLYSFLAVFVLLLLFYKNFKVVLVTVIPIVLTWCITIGVMGMLGITFNVFNVIISTFIFGLGVDYSIFVTNGLLQSKNGQQHTLHLHKTAVLLSVLTTILGVGVLVFAKHPALHSIAWVAIIGIFTAMCVSFTIQPLLYQFLIFKKERKTEL
ncbi:MMPL family transporter [Rasiella rasia]|uniref:MMPL family transporter n=1 Tax=Rasiella rasia TaxID=2744027 RepID=A0A6G6GNJ1_9FLAO|nr:MMPL family transporter [Rasiella rasia]QIE60122.1 MMPL family transporter [Rasiella rasia]